ncbi:MAG: undecaprenyldiphospho-muramoylpentapeptide beta-N-acetylglucosaminyltransferase [Thermodesulfobacteriota bacterium]
MRLIVSGGGTGGHIYPGIAVAEGIISNSPGSRILFIGTERSVDKRAFAGGKFESARLNCQGLKGKGFPAFLKSFGLLPVSLIRALKLVYRFKPDLVLGVGGYVSGPVLLAARIMGKSTCIHEQNSVPGLANRMTGKFVDRVFITYPESEGYFPAGKCILTGNPVRTKVAGIGQIRRLAGYSSEVDDSFTLGVLGGSLGAHRINTLMVKGLVGIRQDLPESFQVLHQTGSADEDMVSEAYLSAVLKARVSEFFEDMVDFYQNVDLVISRSGATSLAEMTVLGIPMILIPYPHAADDHQRRNAEFMVRGGAARMLLEEGLTDSRLAEEILGLLTDKDKRLKMAEAAKGLSRPDALSTIVEECKKIVTD